MIGGVIVFAVVEEHTEIRPALAAGPRSSPRRVLAPTVAGAAGPAPDFSATVTRAEDMLNLGFDFFNMHLVTSTTPAQMVITNTVQPAYMVVVLPPSR